MNFQNLKNVLSAKEYIDIALSHADKKVSSLRSTIKLKSVTKLIKSKRIEIKRLQEIKSELDIKLKTIYDDFPNIDNLPEFYYELMKLFLDVDSLKKSLGAVKWALDLINKVIVRAIIRIKSSDSISEINSLRRSAVGRIKNILNQIDSNLHIIESSRKIMKTFPAVKTKLFSVAIAGFPNVGKSTLLSKLTSANPEINNYAFTTKSLNIGYAVFDFTKVQFIDTPGTLARFDKMNAIEKQAFLVLKYVADVIVFVFDPTETYSQEKQLMLFDQIKAFDKEVIIFISKTDLVNLGALNKNKIFKEAITDIDSLVSKLNDIIKNYDV